MLLESTQINQDITETIKKVNEKIKQVTNNVDIRELEKLIEDMNDQKGIQIQMNQEINEAINETNEQDPDLSDELGQLEAERNNNFQKANNEKIEDDRQPIQQGSVFIYEYINLLKMELMFDKYEINNIFNKLIELRNINAENY